jgi:hypothetical protein
MKPLFILLLCIFASSMFSQDLSNFGHIQNVNFDKEYTIQGNGNHQFINYQGITYPGNTFIPLSSGFATIENTCGNTPPTLRIYNENGDLKTTLSYNQTINPKTDPSHRYLYFLNNKNTVILDTETLKEEAIQNVHKIAVSRGGNLIYFNPKNGQLHAPNYQIEIPFSPHAIELTDFGDIYVFGRHQYALIENNQFHILTYKKGTFFESKTINGSVFWVEKANNKNTFQFTLNQIINNEVVTLDKEAVNMTALSKDINHQRSDGEQIVCPMFPDSIDYPFRIGNSYAEHQWYGGQPYLHPGIDLLGVPDQSIYSPVNGVVKAIITTSGSIHWRLALGLEDTDEEQDGYLFAHLDPLTIPFTLGDSISAGDYIGSIVEWPTSEFHHLHFARLRHQGGIWDGNWLTKDNILSDITNFKDESIPVFEPLWNENTIAFRSDDGVEILEPEHLHDSFDIICHAHDLSNDDWRLDVDSLWYELIDLTTNSVVYAQEAFSYDFELDTYSTNENTLKILNTIYSTEGDWETRGNYNTRLFYQKVSRSNGDGIIDEQDTSVYFDSTIFPDGSYLLRIHAYDAAKNHSSTELEVIINNSPTSLVDLDEINPVVYPNPNTGQFKLKLNGFSLSKGEIYNSLGQLTTVFDAKQTDEKDISILESGIYYIRLIGKDNQVILNQKVIIKD